MSTILKELREQLEILPISELRNKAVKNFGIRLSRDDSKEDIINRIVGLASKQNFAMDVTGDLPEPGWSRIQVSPIPGRSTFPFFCAVNGYHCFIPFNIEVDVPTKIVGILKDAQEMRLTTDEFGNQNRALERSYPYSVIHTTPGPDPRPGLEVSRERKLAVKREFAEREGYWPKDSDIKELRAELSRARLMRDVMASEEKQ